MQPAVEDAAGKLKPAAKDFTSNTLKPAGDYVAENAVPMTKQYGARPDRVYCPALPSFASMLP